MPTIIPRRGYYDIFINTLAQVIFGGFKILNFNIFFFFFWGGVQTNKNFLGGMKILWVFLGGHHKIGLNLGIIFFHFRVFS